MKSGQGSTASIVAQGWILMCLIFVSILATQFMNVVICTFVGKDGGINLKMMAVLMMLHAFVPMLVYTFSARWFRWAIAGLTLLFGVAMFTHEIHLFIATKRTFEIFNLLDFAHHGLAIWVGLIAVRWAREAGQSSVPAANGSLGGESIGNTI